MIKIKEDKTRQDKREGKRKGNVTGKGGEDKREVKRLTGLVKKEDIWGSSEHLQQLQPPSLPATHLTNAIIPERAWMH